MKKPVTMISVIFLALVALAHLGRLFLQIEVVVNGTIMPQWISILGFLVPAGLAIMLQRESTR